jgi:hypothetical protein
LSLLIFQSCCIRSNGWGKICDNKNILTKRVTFNPNQNKSFIYPELIHQLNRKHALSFLIRKPSIQNSQLTSHAKIDQTTLVWELEKALVHEQHVVVDPEVYRHWKLNNPSRTPKFDYIIEIMEAYSTKYFTGINKGFLLGSKLIIKIINPISGQTVGILKKSSIPCTSGCEFKYTECQILEKKVLKTKINYPTNFLSTGFSFDDISELIKSLRLQNQ